jgi:hypothetical protein
MIGEAIQLRNVYDIFFNDSVVEKVTAHGVTVWEKLKVSPAKLTLEAAAGSSASCTVESHGPWTARLEEGAEYVFSAAADTPTGDVPAGGVTFRMDVAASEGVKWHINSDSSMDSWIKVTPSSGTGSANVKVTIAENKGRNARTGGFTVATDIEDGDNKEVYFPVKQRAGAAFFALTSDDDVTVDAAAQNIVFQGQSNATGLRLSVEYGGDTTTTGWLTVPTYYKVGGTSYAMGVTTNTAVGAEDAYALSLTLSAAENPRTTGRSASVTVEYYTGSAWKKWDSTIEIQQSGTVAKLSVQDASTRVECDNSTLFSDVSGEGVSGHELYVETNSDWTTE